MITVNLTGTVGVTPKVSRFGETIAAKHPLDLLAPRSERRWRQPYLDGYDHRGWRLSSLMRTVPSIWHLEKWRTSRHSWQAWGV